MLHLPLIAALALAAPGGRHAPAPAIHVDFDLRGNHGLHAHVSNTHFFGEDVVALEITDKGTRHSVTYRTEGEVTESGLTARFGKLGEIEVGFEPTKTQTTGPPKGCRGEPSTTSEGFFKGRIQFAGERHYVRIERTRAKGELDIERGSTWSCGGKKVASKRAQRKKEEAGEISAWLLVDGARCGCIFEALAGLDSHGRLRTIFLGGRVEEREGMQITRMTSAVAGPSAFVFDHAAGTATVRPPAPFTGVGHYRRRAHGPDLWSSTIRAQVLGAAPVSFRGRRFSAKLQREISFDG